MKAFNLGNSSAQDLNTALLDSFATNGDGSQPVRLKLSEDINLVEQILFAREVSMGGWKNPT